MIKLENLCFCPKYPGCKGLFSNDTCSLPKQTTRAFECGQPDAVLVECGIVKGEKQGFVDKAV